MCCKNNNNRVESVVPGGFIELSGYRLNKWVVASSHQFFNLANVANDDRKCKISPIDLTDPYTWSLDNATATKTQLLVLMYTWAKG